MNDTIINAQKNFLSNLRSQTAFLHEQLEQLPLSLQLTSSELNLETYKLYLQLMYAVNCDAEQNIYPLLNKIIYDANERQKSFLIKNDLTLLQAETGLESFSFGIEQNNFNTAFALGIMYVIEGSTLGGRIILYNVKKILNLDEETGCSYFAGYKSLTSERWKKFISMLVNYQSKTNNDDTIISGAEHAYKVIYKLIKNSVAA